MDEGASRAAARMVGAYVSNATHSAAATFVPPPPGVVADEVVAGDQASTSARIDSALSVQRKYTPALNTAMGRVLKKVNVSRGGGATNKVLRPANICLKWTGVQLLTAGFSGPAAGGPRQGGRVGGAGRRHVGEGGGEDAVGASRVGWSSIGLCCETLFTLGRRSHSGRPRVSRSQRTCWV